jgi:transmembrane sensor
MGNDTKRLERAGAIVAAEVDRGLTAERREGRKRAFVRLVRRGKARRPRWNLAVGAAAIGLLAGLAVAVTLRGTAPEPLEFRVGAAPARADEGQWIRTGAGKAVPVRFADGSEVALEPGASTRVLESDGDRVRIDLASGRVRASIRGDGHRSWALTAGPYRVEVVGTEFSVAWDAGREALDVDVSRGVVVVKGLGIDEQGIRVGAGRRLRADGRKGRATVEQRLEPAAVSWVALRDEPREVEAQVKGAPDAGVHARPRTRPAQETGSRTGAWKDLCDRGDFTGAVNAAEAEGLPALLATLDMNGLWQLADAARYAKRADVTSRALVAFRSRFAPSQKTRVAAFLLGRASVELAHDPAGAQRWFETYLAEDPDGPLAEEALGRLIDAGSRAGNGDRARAAAAQYLARYPGGVFAELARSVAGR